MPRTFLIVLLELALKGSVDPEESNMEKLCNMFPVTQISRLRGTMTQTKYRRSTKGKTVG